MDSNSQKDNSVPSLKKRKLSKETHKESQAFDILAFLKNLFEFRAVPASDLKSIADSSRVVTIEAGHYLNNEGEEANSHGFVVVSGTIAMTKTSTSGKELIVELLQSTDIFGLLLTLGAERLPEQLSARALQRSKVIWIPLKDFTYLLNHQPLLFKDFVAHLLLCLQSSYRLSRGLAHDRVEVRIAAVLGSLILKFSKQTLTDMVPTVHFTRQQLADLTGTTPETAIRVTRAMQRDGIIDIKRPGIIRIIKPNAIHELADE